MHKLYQSINEQNLEPVEGVVTGQIPEWLCGSWYRVGAAVFEVGEYRFNRYDDGFAMISRFHFENRRVTYQNRLLDSEVYRRDMAAQRIVVSGFGTLARPDPCQNIFKRYLSYLRPYERNDNCNINIYPLQDELYATNESNFLKRIDPETLKTLETVDLIPTAGMMSATPNPHYDADGTLHNIGISRNLELSIFKVSPKKDKRENFPKGEIMSAIRSSGKMSINYLHTFGITDNYYVYVEQPYFLNVLKMSTSKLRRSPNVNSFDWYPDLKTRFRIIERKTGKEVNPKVKYEAESFLFHHQINTFECNEHIIVDICAWNSPEEEDFFSLDNLTSEQCEERWRQLQEPRPRRYVLPMNINEKAPKNKNLVGLNHSIAKAEMTSDDTVFCTWELIADKGVAIPRINYAHCNGKKYSYVYGLAWNTKGKHLNTVLKIDINTKTFKEWGEDDCYPSEPAFVPNPLGTGEDDGILLVAVNNSNFDKGQHAFLLVLDARSMEELARVEFGVPRFTREFSGYFKATAKTES